MIRNSSLAVILLTSLLGCSHGPTIVGDWDTTGTDLTGPQTFHFGENGDFKATAETEEKSMSESGKLTVALGGTYTLKEGVFSIAVIHAKMSGLKPEFKSMGETQSKAVEGTKLSGKLEWKDNNRFVVTPDPGPLKPGPPTPMTFNRKN